MANEDQKAVGKEQEKRVKEDTDDPCRCKAASEMTPRELLSLMMNDLAFWKKAKKG